MNILHRRNLGFIYDVCHIITCKTAKRETWIDLFVKNGQEGQDLRAIDNIVCRFDDVDTAMLMFGYRDRKKGSLIGKVFESYAETAVNEWSMEDFITYISEKETITNLTCNFYFECDSAKDNLGKVAGARELPAEVKNQLYEFFIFTDRFIETVIREIGKIADVMQRIHTENLEKLLNCQEEFDYEQLIQKENSPFAKKRRWENGMKNCYVSFSLITKYVWLRGKNKQNGWMVLGYSYQASMTETMEKNVDIAAFGNAFGDKLRVKIVDEIVKNGEMTLADLAKKMGVVNTIAIYHLDILKKENLLLHRYSGRKVLYCLNTSQINKGLEAIKTLCGGNQE